MLKTIFKTLAIMRICDVLTGKEIPSNEIRFVTSDELKVVPKGGGYFVLIGNCFPSEVKIESPVYQELIINDFAKDITFLWLTPKETSHQEKIKLKGKKNQEYYAFAKMNLKLIKNKEENQREIELFMDKNILLEGRDIALVSGEKYYVSKILNKENDKYIIDRDLPKCNKIKTTVSVLYKGTANDKGECTILIPKTKPVEDYIIIDETGSVFKGE